MTKIYVNLRGIREANYKMPAVENRAEDAGYLVERLRNRIPWEIAQKYQISQRMNNVCREIRRLKEKIGELYQVTNSCVDQYEQAELRNAQNAKAFE